MKRKIAYIDHSFKKKTRSNDFVKDLLSEKFVLEELWDYSWKGGKKVSTNYLNRRNFDKIIFFQVLPSLDYLKKLVCKDVIWFPMYDGIAEADLSKFKDYLNLVKVISFSKMAASKLKNIGFKCSYYQYYPEPKKQIDKLDKINIFFWQRRKNISWDVVKKIIWKNPISSVVIKNDLDPGHEFEPPPQKDIKKYNIRIVKGWLSKEKYQKILSCCNVCFASRRYEGIGMSFLEAMAKGMCVVACDNSTMNEYIKDGINGYLYNLDNPRAINLQKFWKVGQKARDTIEKGHYQWQKSKYQLLDDIEK
jgi:glycosyltransferase involved in cell wall biosynthesis